MSTPQLSASLGVPRPWVSARTKPTAKSDDSALSPPASPSPLASLMGSSPPSTSVVGSTAAVAPLAAATSPSSAAPSPSTPSPTQPNASFVLGAPKSDSIYEKRPSSSNYRFLGSSRTLLNTEGLHSNDAASPPIASGAGESSSPVTIVTPAEDSVASLKRGSAPVLSRTGRKSAVSDGAAKAGQQ